jgi:multidrug efflux pump subunit AcrA (membrane-fusion protein)
MRVSACPYPDYGTLKGVVSQISPDAVTPQGDRSNSSTNAQSAEPNQDRGKAFYPVVIKPAKNSLGQHNERCALQLGMEARADIISQEETVLKFVLRKARLISDL